MKRISLFILTAALVLLVPASVLTQSYYWNFETTAASIDLGATGASALALQFKTIVIQASANNTGYVCIGGTSAVTCTAGAPAAATDGLKLSPGDSVTLEGGQWRSGDLYLNNTTANDDVSVLYLE